MLKGIDGSSLRPRQKLVMLERYALPRLSFPLTQEHNPKHTLLELDRLNRAYVRKWLHLHESTSNAVFHCRKTEGGLGLPEFIRSVPTQRINALQALTRRSVKCRKLWTSGLSLGHMQPRLKLKSLQKSPPRPSGKVNHSMSGKTYLSWARELKPSQVG